MKITVDIKENVVTMLKLALMAGGASNEATEFVDKHTDDEFTCDLSEVDEGGIQAALGLAMLTVVQALKKNNIKLEK